MGQQWPQTEKNIWPCSEVCELIERLSDEDLESGIETGVYNKRGVSIRDKGGNQERMLADKFQRFAEVVRVNWPRTARMLLRLSETYQAEAKWHDLDDLQREFE